eukprot:6807192-Pyramimonas_sp.AAC.1
MRRAGAGRREEGSRRKRGAARRGATRTQRHRMAGTSPAGGCHGEARARECAKLGGPGPRSP